MRGIVLPLTREQIRQRALYLAGEAPVSSLDSYVRRDKRPHGATCETIFYLLHDHNGGKDPTAIDPADRWSTQAELDRYAQEVKAGIRARPPFVNRTADCVGGGAWCGGWDRYQEARFAHIYDGWINTDSAILDASGPGRCFVPIDRPEFGDHIVCKSGSLHHAVGHWGVIVGYRLAEWDPAVPSCWAAIDVVNVANYKSGDSSPARANRRTTGAGWTGTGALFLRSVMVP